MVPHFVEFIGGHIQWFSADSHSLADAGLDCLAGVGVDKTDFASFGKSPENP